MRIGETVEDTIASIERFEAMAESKLLTFNSTKSPLVVVGPEKLRNEKEKDLWEIPVLLYNKPMKVSRLEKFLGKQITIKKRKGILMMAIAEIAAVIFDTRAIAD